jgi:hypothetical protein
MEPLPPGHSATKPQPNKGGQQQIEVTYSSGTEPGAKRLHVREQYLAPETRRIALLRAVASLLVLYRIFIPRFRVNEKLWQKTSIYELRAPRLA